MLLPFTHDQFLDVFASYNHALWPAAAVLWLATAVLSVQLIRGRLVSGVAISALLAVHWAWAGVAYHLVYFRAINRAAVGFAALFVVQAIVLLSRGVLRRGLVFGVTSSAWTWIGLALIAYALIYPAVGLATGLRYPRMPTFGVPCPTGILTAGLLLLAPPHEAQWIAPIALIWAVVGGSAAFLLAIRADLLLVAAGLALLVYVARPVARSKPRAG
jgi:hypothetical protein